MDSIQRVFDSVLADFTWIAKDNLDYSSLEWIHVLPSTGSSSAYKRKMAEAEGGIPDGAYAVYTPAPQFVRRRHHQCQGGVFDSHSRSLAFGPNSANYPSHSQFHDKKA